MRPEEGPEEKEQGGNQQQAAARHWSHQKKEQKKRGHRKVPERIPQPPGRRSRPRVRTARGPNQDPGAQRPRKWT